MSKGDCLAQLKHASVRSRHDHLFTNWDLEISLLNLWGFAGFTVLPGFGKSKRHCVGPHSRKQCVKPTQDYLSYEVTLRTFPTNQSPFTLLLNNVDLLNFVTRLGEPIPKPLEEPVVLAN